MSLNESREVLKLRDDELEELIKKWIADKLSEYVGFDRNSGAGDRGLDAVGFLSAERYEGKWDNYQCKQLSKSLGEPEFFTELGKVFYYASIKEFSCPNKYIFVAPKGIARGVRKFIGMPSQLKSEILDNWDIRCSENIVSNQKISMSTELREVVMSFDFRKIEAWNVHKLVEIKSLRKVLHEHVDIDPGIAPKGVVPDAMTDTEENYIAQLITVYGSHSAQTFPDLLSVLRDPDYGPDIQDQRRRYHDADAFHRHFRDNIPDGILQQFNQDVYDGIISDYRSSTGYARLNAVMRAAATIQVSGIFEKHKRAPTSVKQGVCHHLANEGKIKWA